MNSYPSVYKLSKVMNSYTFMPNCKQIAAARSHIHADSLLSMHVQI